MPLFQYQIHTEPVSTRPEAVLESKWHQPWSEPRRDKAVKAFAIALAASGCVFPQWVPHPGNNDVRFSQTETALNYRIPTLYQSIADPIPIIRTGNNDVEFIETLTSIRHDKNFQYQSIGFPTPVIVEVNKWHRPLSEPVRYRHFNRALQQPQINSIPIVIEVVTLDKWYSALSLPKRERKFAVSLQQAGINPVPVIAPTADRWLTPFSTPVRVKRRAADFPFGMSITATAAVPVDKWRREFSSPVRLKRLPTALQQAGIGPVFVPPIGDGSVEFAQTETFLSYKIPTLYQSIADPVPVFAFGTGDVFFYDISTTVLYRKTLQYQSVAEPTPTEEEVEVHFAASPVTVRFKKTVLYPSLVEPVRFTVEVVTLDKWYRQLNEPVRRKPRALTIPVAYTPPSGSQITPSYGWYAPLQGPVRVRPRGYANAPTGFYFQGIQNPVPSMSSWNEWWVNPVRHLSGLLAAMQSDGGWPPGPTPPNPPTPTTGQYTVSGLYVIDQFTDNTVVYDYDGRVSHRTN